MTRESAGYFEIGDRFHLGNLQYLVYWKSDDGLVGIRSPMGEENQVHTSQLDGFFENSRIQVTRPCPGCGGYDCEWWLAD